MQRNTENIKTFKLSLKTASINTLLGRLQIVQKQKQAKEVF